MALTDNLIAFWELDDLTDAHGSNDLTNNGSVPFVSGLIGNAADFEEIGGNQYLSHADNADLSVGDEDFTLQFWVKAESFVSFNTIANKGWTSSAPHSWIAFVNTSDSNKPTFRVDGGGGDVNVVAAAGLSTGTWYCVHVWHDSVNNLIGISVDAGTAVTQAHSLGVQDSGNPFQIGAVDQTGFGLFWDGLIDQVGFWKRVLTSGERTALYNGGAGLAYAAMSGGDTTPPTLGSRAVPTGGTTLTATLDESCTPSSGTGGFTLAGTAATVTSWAIAGGTALTLTLSGTVYSGETVTLSYDRATTTDDIQDAAGNFLASFSAASVTNNSTQVAPSPAGGSVFRSLVISRGRPL